jgi:hypothetical protein
VLAPAPKGLEGVQVVENGILRYAPELTNPTVSSAGCFEAVIGVGGADRVPV